jgi:rhodanese-related sulfurtransferase
MDKQRKFIIATVVSLIFSTQWSFAAESSLSLFNSESPDVALKGIQRAKDVCPSPVEETPPGKKAQNIHAVSAPDLECLISVPDASRLVGKTETVFIDTRSAIEFQEARIEGALNLRLETLSHKTFLRDKTVILVGSGVSERSLYETCAGLKKHSKIKTKVLWGGLVAWSSYGLPLQGMRSEFTSLGELRTDELLAEGMFDANLVLVNRGNEAVRKVLTRSVLLSSNSLTVVRDAVDEFLKHEKKRTRTPSGHPFVGSVVWVTGGKVSAEEIGQVRQALQPLPVLVYNKTTDVFAREYEVQQSVWIAQSRNPKQPKCSL